MAKNGRKQSVLFLTGVALAAMPAAAAAQDAAADNSGDIIVTAQRQEQRLQDVPVSVTAFGAEQLRDNSIETVQDIAIRTPGLAISAVDPVNTNFAMRGIGSAPGISQIEVVDVIARGLVIFEAVALLVRQARRQIDFVG